MPHDVQQFYVSTDGDDRWSGTLPDPNTGRSDGPFKSITGARNRIRELKTTGGLRAPVVVSLRGGRHTISTPIEFTPADTAPVTFTSFPNEHATISGGRRIDGWREEKRGDLTVWVTDNPDVANGAWYFRQLFVNGRRAMRPRYPRTGFARIHDVPDVDPNGPLFVGANRFVVNPGDLSNWRNLDDVEIVVLHYWIEERMPIVVYDDATNVVECSRSSRMRLRDEREGWAKFYVENIAEELSEPGDWYLDRHTGELVYIPLPDETLDTAEVWAPVADQLIRFVGKPDVGQYVEFIRFTDFTFEHTRWHRPPDNAAAWSQAANGAPAAIEFTGARSCAIENCVIQHVGAYGIAIGDGCNGVRVVGNELADLGAGGVKINGADARGPVERRTGNNRITDNHLHHGGEVFHSAIGVLSMHSFGNIVSHNHIHDFYYTGISCGWVWGYSESVSKNNRIEKNHIHSLGKAWLSDMGGIYTLGVQPGTVLRGNLIHDVEMAVYGGWAIYPDEGSSHILIENNIGYNTSSQSFHQHYGRENMVRNNIWAFGREGNVRCTRIEPHLSFVFERNIMISDGIPIYCLHEREHPHFISDLNVAWDVSGAETKLVADHAADTWREIGNDRHTVIADPKFADVAHGDFTLAADSPAIEIGFKPIDISDVGPRPQELRD